MSFSDPSGDPRQLKLGGFVDNKKNQRSAAHSLRIGELVVPPAKTGRLRTNVGTPHLDMWQ